jgi:hypothetical protein
MKGAMLNRRRFVGVGLRRLAAEGGNAGAPLAFGASTPV